MNRKILISVAFIFVALSLANCQREPAIQPVAEADKTIPSYHVPREKALAELNSFLADVDANNTTRGGKIRQIKDVTPILGDKFQNTTRVSEDEAAAAIDTLLYMVNFEDEEGYAVLSAVDFLAPIIAVIDEGSADSTLLGVIGHPINPDNILEIGVDDCCIGYYEDELIEDMTDTITHSIVNPPSDSLIFISPLSLSNEVTRSTTSTSTIDHNIRFATRIINDYCEFKLIDHNNPEGSGDYSGGNTGGSGNDGSGNNTGDDSGDNGGNISPQDWVTISQVQPMLQTNWHQAAPFNFFCPEREGGTSAYEGRAPVGCPAIALGQVIAYHRFPSQVGDVTLLWDYISYPLYDDEQLIFKQWHIAKFLYELGDKFIEQDYYFDKSGASMRRVRIAMERLGFRNVSKNCGYRENDIMAHLNTQRPFIIGASSPKNARIGQKKGGHTWVIDGYIKRQRSNQVEIMMHCNMGNGGTADGYYHSGIFNTTTATDENENLLYDGDDDKYNFCRYYRNINYDKPTPQL